MPELGNHLPPEQMIIWSFISREALKTSSFSENLFGKKKKNNQTKSTVFKMEGYFEHSWIPKEMLMETAMPS